MKKVQLVLVFALLVFVSCKKKKENEVEVVEPVNKLEVHLVPKANGQDYVLDQVIASPLGYRYFFTDVKMLGTDMSNGSAVFSDSYFFDFRTWGTLVRSTSGSAADFGNLNMNIGVPTSLNNADPSLPPSTSALNILNSGAMHWGWNPGYIFVKLEGKVDTTDNGIDDFDHNFLFHLGMDPLFRTLSFNGINWSASGVSKYRTNLNLFVKEIFDKSGDEVDLRVDYISHSLNNQMVLSNKIMDNLVNSIEKE
jgi:hypothetical protein